MEFKNNQAKATLKPRGATCRVTAIPAEPQCCYWVFIVMVLALLVALAVAVIL